MVFGARKAKEGLLYLIYTWPDMAFITFFAAYKNPLGYIYIFQQRENRKCIKDSFSVRSYYVLGLVRNFSVLWFWKRKKLCNKSSFGSSFGPVTVDQISYGLDHFCNINERASYYPSFKLLEMVVQNRLRVWDQVCIMHYLWKPLLRPRGELWKYFLVRWNPLGAFRVPSLAQNHEIFGTGSL